MARARSLLNRVKKLEPTKQEIDRKRLLEIMEAMKDMSDEELMPLAMLEETQDKNKKKKTVFDRRPHIQVREITPKSAATSNPNKPPSSK
jgi:hypothetical protein